MKRILYYMGPGAYDTYQMASLENFKSLSDPLNQDPSWRGFPCPKIEKNVRFRINFQKQCFKYISFLEENNTLLNPTQ